MIPENVTLIVKAPNQQIEDQNIECQSSWTVKQLKGHLSEVYPNKPLLDDSTIIKDVLRTYDTQTIHTMHLVCTPTRRMTNPIHNPEPSTDGLRRRNVEPSPLEAVPRAESQNHQNHNVEMQNYLNSAMNNYGRHTDKQQQHFPLLRESTVLMKKRVCTSMLSSRASSAETFWTSIWQASIRAEPPPPAAPAPVPEPPAEDEEAHRDWLDHLYAASRLAILSSLIYLYGSGARLLLNLPAGNQNQPAGNQDQPAGNQDQPAGNQDQPAGNQGQPAGNQPAANQPAGNQGNQPETAHPDERSLWSVTWMIFTTFFASLIPEANQ
ncbi:Homocysteine-responsive endoplasmic reticulum-resident ubiquitin-like domain member 2 protein [Operophtera brumata]|uniref:Homocysteine-responsive endoplasmic reticulum-resident ubiquitin-like domain member 2 protein n=1 Tax=Operophtera brumata TaxID=104452 RepID=A0A0L7L3Y2_OPEBR|nr:Homocysteine-responsive endoplasmic reticulum-resident ubiquitin-like domain member 2 protein [Operophtera brumata]